MRQKIILPIIIAMFLFCLPMKAAAAQPVSVKVGDVTVSGAFLYGDTTMVPLRSFCQAMSGNCAVSWDSASHTAGIKTSEFEITCTSNCSYIIANGRYLYVGGCCYITGSGSMVLPVRVLAGAFDASLSWDSASRTVSVQKGSGAIKEGSEYYAHDAVYWLSRIISAEACGESLEGQIAVGDVVLNRVASSDYPNTIYDVIFDQSCGVQFSPTANGMIYNMPTESAVIAAKIALEGTDVVGDSEYFLNEAIATSSWIVKNCLYVTTIGNHSFYT